MKIESLAVLTSGGDAPGMNAAVRAVVRSGLALGVQVHGVEHGFSGLIEGRIRVLGSRDVGGIIGRGGTFLGSARCTEMRSPEGQQRAIEQLRSRGIGGLVVIGGNGSQTGAHALAQRGLPVVGVASTIDNDLVGSNPSIGSTTAADIALEAIDRLRVTGSSHGRAFLVEVMGRDCGFLALLSGLAGGAEAIVLPGDDSDPEQLAAELFRAAGLGKRHAIVVVAEGAPRDADALAAYFKAHEARLGYEVRVTRLGHVQRGGAPGVYDRVLATRLGAAAPEQLLAGHHGVLVGLLDDRITCTPLDQVAGRTKDVDPQWVELARAMAR